MRLSVTDLACRRGGRRVFADLSFALGPGDALIVTGRNGAGKSTLLAALAGFVRPERGSVTWTAAPDVTLAEDLHLLSHRDGLKGALTAAENLAAAAALLGRSLLTPAAALARVGLPGAAGLPVAFLSAGQRRRVALARLVVARRPVWLLDEPTTALDTAGSALVTALMAEHRAEGGLVIAATHLPLDLPDCRSLALGTKATNEPGRAKAYGGQTNPSETGWEDWR